MTAFGRDLSERMVEGANIVQDIDLDSDSPQNNIPLFRSEKRQSWGSVSVDVVNRAAGEAICRSDSHWITYMVTDFDATLEDDDRPPWQCRLARGTFVYRPPDTTLRCNATAGRFIRILQSRETYDNLAQQLVRGGGVRLEPRYTLEDPLVSQFVWTLANEMATGMLDHILAGAVNTALAARLIRYFVDPSALVPAPANGLSGERLGRVRDYIEAHLAERLSLDEIADVACLSPYHFSRSFKQAIGVGPHRYLVQRRIERAKALIRSTNHPLCWIAQEAGFTDQSHLISVFRREIGITPGRFRAATA
jgi:AraC family transcriptional regulator